MNGPYVCFRWGRRPFKPPRTSWWKGTCPLLSLSKSVPDFLPVHLPLFLCPPTVTHTKTRDKIMEMIHFISADRHLLERIPDDLMSGNMAAFPAPTKRHFWVSARVTIIQSSERLSVVFQLASKGLTWTLGAGWKLLLSSSWTYSRQCSQCVLYCVHVHAFTVHWLEYISSFFPFLSFLVLLLSFFFFKFNLRKPWPCHIHGGAPIHHKSHSRSLEGSVWECEPA